MRTSSNQQERETKHAHTSWPTPWRHDAYQVAQYKTVHDAIEIMTSNDLTGE